MKPWRIQSDEIETVYSSEYENFDANVVCVIHLWVGLSMVRYHWRPDMLKLLASSNPE